MDVQVVVVIVVLVALVALAAFLLLRNRSRQEVVSTRAGAPRGAVLGGRIRINWGSKLGEETWERIEEGLLAADLGVAATSEIVDGVRSARPADIDSARAELSRRLEEVFVDSDRTLAMAGDPSVILVVGVNGTGKTTTIAKLANVIKADGDSVLLGAADTFRAAAGEQLETWARRVGVDIVGGQEGGDPASVAHDAITAAKARGIGVVIIDTAGRLHGKKNLMGELSKIHRVASAEASVDEVLLVLDATAGQNGLAQVSEFTESVPLTGIVLTKLDGTAKGGIVVAVEKQLGVPVKFVGIGEGVDDLLAFEPGRFVEGLLEDA